MSSRVNYFVLILSVSISSIFFYPFLFLLSRIASNDQVNNPVQDSGIFEEVFQYPDVFLRNYALMEKGFKIFVYPNRYDEIVLYNEKFIRGRFSNEVFFTYRLMLSERFNTKDDTEANMFFIPFTWFRVHETGNYANAVKYVREIIDEYPHWNRSKGVDHFLVTSSEAGAFLSEFVPLNNSITLSCLTSYDSSHDISHKHHHITLPQMRLPFVPPVRGNHITKRTILAFWACHKNYSASEDAWFKYSDTNKFKASKYCICDGASYVTRICITDSIHFGCVPVILYEDYELPFGDILDWTKFSVIINKDNAHLVEQILEAISDSKFSELHNNVLKVQRHFQADSALNRDKVKPYDKPYDVFHMIMYELWLRHLANTKMSTI